MDVFGVDVVGEVGGGARADSEDAPEGATDTAGVETREVDVAGDGG